MRQDVLYTGLGVKALTHWLYHLLWWSLLCTQCSLYSVRREARVQTLHTRRVARWRYVSLPVILWDGWPQIIKDGPTCDRQCFLRGVFGSSETESRVDTWWTLMLVALKVLTTVVIPPISAGDSESATWCLPFSVDTSDLSLHCIFSTLS